MVMVDFRSCRSRWNCLVLFYTITDFMILNSKNQSEMADFL